MRKAIYGLTGLCILLVAFALIIPSLVEWNSYKYLINSEVRKATGRSLDIAGDVELSFLPMPHIRATDLRLRNAPSASVANMVTMKELRASIKLLPLLTGNVEIAVV
ncbi:MAG: AsmA family protein, partial [Pseudomonadota bacterium]|nr:AsmA family protein [Pseudomonadota bacterium]